jgi:hypothetical protein
MGKDEKTKMRRQISAGREEKEKRNNKREVR